MAKNARLKDGDPSFWRCRHCHAHDCWSHPRSCYVCGRQRSRQPASGGVRRSTAWNGQKGQPPSLPPSVGAAGAPTPPAEKLPPKAVSQDDSEIARLIAQVVAAKDFFPSQLEAAQRELDEYREKRHQHRLATKPRHFVLITLQREVTQAQKRVDSGKTAVHDILAKIEAFQFEHAAAVEDLALRHAKLETAQRRRNDAEANPAKPPLASEITTLKEQIAACGPALGDAGGNILKSLEAIMAQLGPEHDPMSVDVPVATPNTSSDFSGGVAGGAAGTANGGAEARETVAKTQGGGSTNGGDILWPKKRSELKRCLDQIKGDMGDDFNLGVFTSFYDVLGHDDEQESAAKHRRQEG